MQSSITLGKVIFYLRKKSTQVSSEKTRVGLD